MISAPIFFSQSNRSRDMPCGKIAMAVQSSTRAIKRAAAAKIARGRPRRLVLLGIELAADESRHQAAERRANLMRAGGKIFSDQPDDPRLHAGDRRRNFQIIHAAVEARLHVVLPRDAEKVHRVHVPQPDAFELPLDGRRDERRIPQLLEGRKHDAALAAARRGSLDDFRMECLMILDMFSLSQIICQFAERGQW